MTSAPAPTRSTCSTARWSRSECSSHLLSTSSGCRGLYATRALLTRGMLCCLWRHSDFDDDRFLPGYTEPLAPSTCESIGDDVPASVAGSSQDGPPTQHTDTRAHAARQHGDEKYEHGQEGLDSEDDSFHADLLAQSVILAKCEQLQEALDEAVHQKQQLEERLSRAEDLCQEHAIRCLEAEETIARLQEALDAGRSTNLQQQEQITALEHEVQILELTLRRRKEEEEEEGPPAQPTREAEGTQNQLREWVSLYRSEAARCEELQIKLRLLQLQSADNDRSRGHDTAGGSGGEGSDKESEEVWKPLGEEQNGYGDHGAQVLNSLIQLAATLGNCSLHEKRGRILNQMDHFLQSEDTSTSVLAILALGALGMGRKWETNSTSDHITEMMASRCPSAVGRATALLKTGGSRSRRYSALLLCTLSQSSTGRNRIEQHRPCLPTIIKALADKDIFAATYAVQTVWCLVNHAGTHIWCNRASFGPSQVAAALHAAAHRPGVDPAITEKALAAVHLLQ